MEPKVPGSRGGSLPSTPEAPDDHGVRLETGQGAAAVRNAAGTDAGGPPEAGERRKLLYGAMLSSPSAWWDQAIISPSSPTMSFRALRMSCVAGTWRRQHRFTICCSIFSATAFPITITTI